MRRTFSRLLALAFVALASRAEAAPAASHRDAAFEERITRELRATAPDAVPLFEQATAAYDANDYPTATDLYAKVIAQAPTFSHAKRRECGALAADGKRSAALPFCRAALAQEESPENEVMLAATLVGAKGFTASDGDVTEAKGLAERAVAAKPDDAFGWSVLFEAGAASNDIAVMRRSSERLQEIAPNEPGTHVFASVLAAVEGDRDGALRELDRAQDHGLSKAEYDRLGALLDEAGRPWWLRAASFLGRAVVAWLLVLFALLGAGYALSRITLRAVALHPTEPHARPHEVWLRRVYRALLFAASAFYYASLPLLAVVVLAAMGGVIAGIVAAGYIALKLFVILAIVAVVSVSAIVRSVFVRARDEDPGIPLDLNANPQMKRALAEVAARIGTRPVDRVFVTPFTDVAVFDRGGLLAQLRGKSQRCLVLGAGVLEGMRLRAFKSVLAHEYGHFRNEDTAGGGFALAVRRSLSTMAVQLVTGGAASLLNPAWWFVRGFWRAFLGISQGASRLQEVLADRWAAFAYGSSAFEEGLRHVIARDVQFGAHVDTTLDEVVRTKRPLANLYAYVPAAPKGAGEIQRAIDDVLARAPSPYDSHPCPTDRLAWVRALAADGVPATAADDAEAWSLFADRAEIEAQMTADVRARVQRVHGVVVAPG